MNHGHSNVPPHCASHPIAWSSAPSDAPAACVQEPGPAAPEPGQPKPSWADSPASPAVAVLEQRAKAWSLAQRFSSATELQEDYAPEPGYKRQRRH